MARTLSIGERSSFISTEKCHEAIRRLTGTNKNKVLRFYRDLNSPTKGGKMRNTKIAMLRDALEHLKRERRNVDAIVYERVRRAVCRRFPNFTYEQIIADIHNERKITGIKTVVRADIISSLNRKIAKATALLQVYERKNRKRKKRAITAPSPSATEQ